MIRIIKNIFRYIPIWIKDLAKISIDNRNSLELDNGSRVKAITTSADAGRSEAVSLLIVDEAAHIENFEEIWTGISPTVSCVVGNTRVLTDQGYLKIEDIAKSEIYEKTFNIDNVKVWGKEGIEIASCGYKTRKSDTIILKTKKGLEIEGTLIHPLYKLDENIGGKMTSLQNLKLGDFLRVDVGMNIFGSLDYSKDNLAYMIGGYIAEGWGAWHKRKNGDKHYHSIYVSNSDKEFRDVYLQNKIIKQFKDVGDNQKLKCTSSELIKVFKDVGVDFSLKCDQKIIPEKIWKSNKETISQFLQGYFDGDGCVCSRGIIAVSTSEKLLQEIQLLLLNIGIISNISKKDNSNNKDIGVRIMPQGTVLKSLKNSYRLIISRSQYKIFQDNIGFKINRKKQKLKDLSEKYIQDDRKQFKIATRIVRNRILHILENTKKSFNWFENNGVRIERLRNNDQCDYINNVFINKLIKTIEDNNLPIAYNDNQFLKELSYKCYWDEIVEIRYSEAETYDLTVPRNSYVSSKWHFRK